MIPLFGIPIWFIVTITSIYLINRLLYRTSIIKICKNCVNFLREKFHIYNLYKFPQYNEFSQENLLFRKISTYIKSLNSLEDSNNATLYSGEKPGDVLVSLGLDQTVLDTFLHARVTWTYRKQDNVHGSELILRVKSRDKRRILGSYIQHIYKTVDEIEQRKKEIRIYLNDNSSATGNVKNLANWRVFPFVSPSKFDTIILDNEVKNKVKNDLDQFMKSRQYYEKICRVWRRSYLLYGGPGTGKSSFAAAMAKFLSYDIYDLDLSNVSNGSDLKTLLMQTTRQSLILVENLDSYLMGGSESGVSLSAVLNFMDGVVSSCGDERIMVFTMNCKDRIDPLVLRPGRVDVHIYFPFCDFSVFKGLALSHLGVKEHKLFGHVEELFRGGSRVISPAEISEIMISNRSSPSRAIKLVIASLGNDKENMEQGVNCINRRARVSIDFDHSGSGSGCGSGSGDKREGNIAMREIQKLYGIMTLKNSRRQPSIDLSSS